ncbi:stalk domain-containing protein [Paenibacillus brevis]|uniref:Copper amine oxidase N-terminal domain-containing protein n=1 Tax=Paenibacillus brevis TaxID=2841508 RepID=A0ABS6FJ86_9BACL|nr:stalk domain-containing protein [Paenibacillus brevis]MBU5670242.1 copper amine oxidase N-terminal domain-containing protein [Paenibacillus brevis]
MKKPLYTIFILCIGVVIGMTSTAAADPVKQYVQASFEKIIFVVNGEEKPLDADPLVYQGTTYLPVRTVLNTLGYDVGYKADTKTVTADKSEIPSLGMEGEKAELNANNYQDNNKQIESLNHSITREKETIETLEIMIQNAKGRDDVSEQSKKEKIEDYNTRIERSKANIEMYEAKISELQK